MLRERVERRRQGGGKKWNSEQIKQETGYSEVLWKKVGILRTLMKGWKKQCGSEYTKYECCYG
jgi:hypothetical protein